MIVKLPKKKVGGVAPYHDQEEAANPCLKSAVPTGLGLI